MTGRYTVDVSCDHRGWGGAACGMVAVGLTGDQPQALAAARRQAREQRWVRKHGPGSHGYDLCPFHATELPGLTFPDWRNGRVDVAAQHAQVIARAAEAFAEDMRRQQIHVGIGSPSLCATDGQPWPCDAVNRPEPACLADADDHPDRALESGGA